MSAPLGSVLIIATLAVAAGGCSANGNPRPAAIELAASARPHVKMIVKHEAARMGIPVSLALAVAHAESNFNPYAVSRKGARGVMQIMPATAVAEYGIEPGLLWNPRINIRVGLHFLGRLLERYRGRVDLALSYYNGGSAVGDLPYARVIPATRRFVTRVKRLQAQYRIRLARGEV